MRIALRTGGGRGVYELAGSQGDIHASSLFDRNIFYELTPNIIVPGRAIASRLSGKPRIRLEDKLRTTHFYRLLAAVLLLPKPKREFKKTHGSILLTREAYSMTAIKVDVESVEKKKVILRPTDLLLENADKKAEKVVFADRMARITQLWEVASQKASPFASLLRAHMEATLAAVSNHKTVEQAADAISKALKTNGDPLPLAEREMGIIDPETQSVSTTPTATAALESDFAEDDATQPLEARLERVKQWRLMAARGRAGQKFRRDVTSVYDFRCIFSGDRLPRTEATESAAVDAAHILPWSTHNINSVTNGLCLNKLCHWAFDAGALRFFFDKTCNAYVVEIPDRVRLAAKKASFDLVYFEKLCKPIPAARLPKNKAEWPSPKYLDDLNKVVFSDAT